MFGYVWSRLEPEVILLNSHMRFSDTFMAGARRVVKGLQHPWHKGSWYYNPSPKISGPQFQWISALL